MPTAPPESASIVLAHRDPATLRILESIVAALGHNIAASVGTGAEIEEAVARTSPDLVISSFYLNDGACIDSLIRASREDPIPSVIVTSHDDLAHVEKALEDHVMAYMVEPITKDELRPTIYLVQRRFAEFVELREEVEGLENALEARKVVERAKGYLMREQDLSEEDAHRKLQKLASEKRKKIREVAEAILLAAEI